MACGDCNSGAGRCPPVFDRVHVSYLIRGGTRVMWDLVPEFTDPQPHVFQLQAGRVGLVEGGEWEDIGLPMENSFYAIDGSQHVYGMTQWTHYRVALTTPRGVYYSEPTNLLGVLDRRDWRIAREIVRKERLRHRLVAQDGYLLKRRFSGLKCPTCLDLQTDVPRNPDCPVCFGTGYQCGYYYPLGCVWADLSPQSVHKEIDTEGSRGVIADIIVSARMLAVPLLEEYDVWVSADTDDRYYVHRIQNLAEIRGVPLILSAELRLAAYTDVIYDVQIPEQIAATEGG